MAGNLGASGCFAFLASQVGFVRFLISGKGGAYLWTHVMSRIASEVQSFSSGFEIFTGRNVLICSHLWMSGIWNSGGTGEGSV